MSAPFLSDQHQVITNEIGVCTLVDQVPLGQLIHPNLVGREEHVSRDAILDLLCQHRARPIDEHHLAAVIFRGDRIQGCF
jgi:hypothetical protein